MASGIVTDFAIALGLLSLVDADILRKHVKKIQMIAGVSLIIDLIKRLYMFYRTGDAPSPSGISIGIVIVAGGILMISSILLVIDLIRRAYMFYRVGKVPPQIKIQLGMLVDY